MKVCRWAALLLAAMIATAGLPAAGEASDVLARTFLERAGVAPDAATLARAEAFLEAEAIDADLLDLIPEDRLRAYGAHLRDDLPIAYPELMESKPVPLPGDTDYAALKRLLVLLPRGSAAASALVDFERGRVYADEGWPVYQDVCRAAVAKALTGETAGEMRRILRGANLPQCETDYLGDMAAASMPLCLALEFEGGVTRYTVAGHGSNAPRALIDALYALYAAA